MTIWKYALKAADLQRIDMPTGARIIHVDEQQSEPHIWAIVDETAPLEPRYFTIVGTGHRVPVGIYIGTANCGRLVWHIFESRLAA